VVIVVEVVVTVVVVAVVLVVAGGAWYSQIPSFAAHPALSRTNVLHIDCMVESLAYFFTGTHSSKVVVVVAVVVVLVEVVLVVVGGAWYSQTPSIVSHPT
jgi:hypothetical protein